MNILYLGKYKERFQPIIEEINNLPRGSSVLELCFGDVYLAEFCKKAGYHWKGLDINTHFVETARRMGFDAHCEDLVKLEVLPAADACVMMGSLYHFHPDAGIILEKMFKASGNVLISEPVSNLSSKTGIIGFLAKRAANAGKGHEVFRYDKRSFLDAIGEKSKSLDCRVVAVKDHGKDLIVKLIKK